MTTTVPIPDVRQFLTDPDPAGSLGRNEERIEEPILADAEEEEIAQLWAADPGNQGA
jgi:hypothetical protein